MGGVGEKTLERRLVEAVKAGRAREVGDLLAAGADPQAEDVLGHRAIDHAVWGAQPECLKVLLGAGARLERERLYPGSILTDFAAHMGPRCAQILLAAGADPMVRNDDRRSPLMLAAAAGDVDAVEALLRDPRVSRLSHLNSVDRDGLGALEHAGLSGGVEVAKVLAGAGALAAEPQSRRPKPGP